MTKESNKVAYVVKDAVYVASWSVNNSLSNILDEAIFCVIMSDKLSRS